MGNYSKKIISSIVDSDLIPRKGAVIVGFSGGPDSLCLLHALCELRDSMEIDIIPVHVNHKLRPNADPEQDHAVAICDRLDLDGLVYEADCRGMAEDLKISEEEAGRKIRYEIFDEVAGELEAAGIDSERIVIAVAHNSDDQSETVLFRVIRGTGVHGLAGISKRRVSVKGYEIIRPLLDVSREDIEGYIEENKLHPNIDETNSSTDYTRNRIRLELIPYIEKHFNPNVKKALKRLAENASVEDEFMEGITAFECENCLTVDDAENKLILDVDYALNLPLALVRRIIGTAFEILGIIESGSHRLTLNVIDLMMSDNPSAVMNLPGGVVARRRYKELIFGFENGDEKEDSIEANDDQSINPKIVLMKEYNRADYGLHAAFDFDEFSKEYPGCIGEIKVRTRRDGDYIAIKGGRKKIQDFFVDSKLPKEYRDSIRMVAIGSEILWILPDENLPTKQLQNRGKFSQNYQITEASSRVLFLEYTNILC